ncbi:FOP N terminal dimerization domain-containing protein [Paraphysoderma sedebokerense]|nr:FOP N terminal dimerization domain-containing protein [Paraphysoderma sedebokerense]
MVEVQSSLAGLQPLKLLVNDTLYQRGILPKLKAQLRASIFAVLKEQQSSESNLRNIMKCSPDVLRIRDNVVGSLAIDLIHEFMKFFDMEYAAEVFNAEANVESSYQSRNNLADQLGIRPADNSKPLLVELVEAILTGDAPAPDSSATNPFINNPKLAEISSTESSPGNPFSTQFKPTAPKARMAHLLSLSRSNSPVNTPKPNATSKPDESALVIQQKGLMNSKQSKPEEDIVSSSASSAANSVVELPTGESNVGSGTSSGQGSVIELDTAAVQSPTTVSIPEYLRASKELSTRFELQSNGSSKDNKLQLSADPASRVEIHGAKDQIAATDRHTVQTLNSQSNKEDALGDKGKENPSKTTVSQLADQNRGSDLLADLLKKDYLFRSGSEDILTTDKSVSPRSPHSPNLSQSDEFQGYESPLSLDLTKKMYSGSPSERGLTDKEADIEFHRYLEGKGVGSDDDELEI